MSKKNFKLVCSRVVMDISMILIYAPYRKKVEWLSMNVIQDMLDGGQYEVA
jgi:hypothetical protein